MVLLHWIVLVALISLSTYWLVIKNKFRASPFPHMHIIAFGLVPVISILIISALHSLQGARFSTVGYLVKDPLIIKTAALSLAPFALYWTRVWRTKEHSTLMFFGCALISVLILKFIPLNLFPVTAKRSDLLPILKEAGLAVYNGESPYKYYMLDNGVSTPNARFPGLILAYFPAAISGKDLRYITLFFETAIFIILISKINSIASDRTGLPGFPWQIIVPVICFMMFPYWHFRHELYESPFWLILFMTLLAFDNGHKIWFSLGLASLTATHQWGLLFVPLMLIGFYKKHGFRIALLCFLPTMLLCSMIFVGFLKGNYSNLFHHTLGIYDVGVPVIPTSMFLSLWFAKFHLEELLLPLKLATQFPIVYLTFRYGHTASALAGIMALSLTLVLMFNIIAWTYQYLLVVFLLIVGWLFHEGLQTSQPD